MGNVTFILTVIFDFVKSLNEQSIVEKEAGTIMRMMLVLPLVRGIFSYCLI